LEGETNNTVTTVTGNVTPPMIERPKTASKPRKLKQLAFDDTLHETAVTNEHVTDETGELCICGCGRPRRPGSMYHKDGCRVRLLRHKRALVKDSKESMA
jgi:hypothetical protein